MMVSGPRSLLITVLVGAWVICNGCGGGGGGSSSNSTQTVLPSGQNVLPIAVDGGPTASMPSAPVYINAAFTSVTVCIPGTSNCQTIGGVLVDTGSYGLRLLSSQGGGALTLALPVQTSGDNQLCECTKFADGSYVWGSVRIADVKLAGETASSIPIHVLEHNLFTIPSDCSSGGGSEEDDLQDLGANGILGVGPFQQDCGSACVPVLGGSPPTGVYYVCSAASGCRPAFVNLSQQVQNPVGLFPVDNNGVIVKLPPVSPTEVGVKGVIVFGIGTQANNGLGSVTVLTLNQYPNMTTFYNNQSLPYSFIDSGTNGYYFPDPAIPVCSDSNYSSYYCPPTTLHLSATNQGANGTQSTVEFSIGNAEEMFKSPSTVNYLAFSDWAGPNNLNFPSDSTTQDSSLSSFEWGLPFFYGRDVYTAIEDKDTPAGTGPYWAY
ncbi:MAG TPA: DUF3443 domain-containing protein [Desulfomonilia bacterium]|nr:DUF3443 domain-containing protein [Desulfomonilia bacterium]